MIISKGRSVIIIHLLALFGKYKNIVDVPKSNIFFIDFDKTMMRI